MTIEQQDLDDFAPDWVDFVDEEDREGLINHIQEQFTKITTKGKVIKFPRNYATILADELLQNGFISGPIERDLIQRAVRERRVVDTKDIFPSTRVKAVTTRKGIIQTYTQKKDVSFTTKTGKTINRTYFLDENNKIITHTKTIVKKKKAKQ